MSVENHRNEYFHNPYAPNTTKLFDLNDDCILEILQRLSVLDLCAIRSTCKRFETLAEYYFNMVYKSLNFNYWNIKSNDQYQLLTEEETKTILTSFGPQIDSLTVNADSFISKPEEVLQIINEYCGDRRLNHFKMVKFVFDEEVVDRCQRLLSNIEQLTIDKCYGDDVVFVKLLKQCTALTHLELIRQLNIDGTCLLHQYPTLEGFSLKSNDNFDPNFLNTFLKKNPQLKILKLIGCNFVDDEIFEIIADNLCNLETLCIRVVHISSAFETNLNNLLKLQHLRKLEFNCGLRPIIPFITGLAMTNRIESLGISSAEWTAELCSVLCNLKNLQILKLISLYDEPEKQTKSIRPLAEHLDKLTEMHIVECEFIQFDDIIEFVERAPKLKKLVLIQCIKILPFDGAQFIRLAESCQKRVDKLQLTVHMDYNELKSTKEQISDNLRREYLSILQLVSLSWEDNYNVGTSDNHNLYFAEEGGAYDYEVDADFDEDYDDDINYDVEMENDPYNVWNDDFDDEDLYPF